MIDYRRFNPHTDPSLLPLLIQAYQQVFATAPWSEWKRCAVCGKQWGLEEESELEALDFICCGQQVQDYWITEQVETDILHELENPNASCWIALDNGQLVGFTWGYELSLFEIDQKLKIEVSSALITQFGETRIAYQDEVGVVASHRKRGIARELVERRRRDFLDSGLAVGVVRTKEDPPSVTFIWYLREGYGVIARYGEGRVVMSRSL